MNISNKIKDLRKINNMTQPELAEKIGVANSVISNWELGKNIPRSDFLLKLAQTFQVSADYLLDIEDDFGNKEFSIPKVAFIDKNERVLVEAYRELSPAKKKALLDLLGINSKSDKNG